MLRWPRLLVPTLWLLFTITPGCTPTGGDSGPDPRDQGAESDGAGDMASPMIDMAFGDAQPRPDARPQPDAAPPEPDMAPPAPDMAPPAPDMNPPAPDMAPPAPDMAPPAPDMAPPAPDMGPPEPDAAPPEPDAAPPEPDAAPPECPDGQHACPEGCCADACTVGDLGAALGQALIRVDTRGRPDDFQPSCQRQDGPDAALAWVAPADGRYRFTTDGAGHDTVLTLLDAGCDGPELGCDDDGGEGLRSRLTVDLVRGQAVVIVVDGYNGAAGEVPVAITAEGPEVCDDGLDNDGDGATDCADEACSADPACRPLSEVGLCDDLRDNDGDGRTDCADPDCAADPACLPDREVVCDDGLDADRDGLTDCDDPDCDGSLACRPESEVGLCANGEDDDRDGRADCADADCAGDPACRPAEELDCGDGRDNDDDGAIDCADDDCADSGFCLAARCRAPGACDDAACAGHPVCCADVDLGSATGLDVGAGNNAPPGDRRQGTCGGADAPERTFAWTAPADGTYLFDTSNAFSRDRLGGLLDSTLYLLDGCEGRTLDCNSDALTGSTGSRVSARLTAGQTVLIAVDGNGFAEQGQFLLSIAPGSHGSALACGDGTGDGARDCDGLNCADACDCLDRDIGMVVEPLVLRSSTARGDNRRRGSCGGAGDELMVRWVAPESASYTFRVEPAAVGGAYDPVLYLLDGTCAGAELACADDIDRDTRSAEITRFVSAGRAVVLGIDSAADPGDFLLSITVETEAGRCADGRDNDGDWAFDCADPDCAGAPNCACPDQHAGSAVGPAIARGSTAGHGHRIRLSCGTDRTADARLTWTAPAAGTYTFDLDADFDYLLGVLDGDCVGDELACAANRAATAELAADQTVTVVVDGALGNGRYAGNFALNVWAADEAGRCEDGIDSDGDGDIDCDDSDCEPDAACSGFCLGGVIGDGLGDAVFEGDLADASDDSRPPCLDWTISDDVDAGFEWTAPYAGRFQFDTFGSAARTSLTLLDGSCYGDALACTRSAPGLQQSRLEADLEAGQTVVLVVDIAQRFPEETGFRINIHPTEFGLCDDGVDNDGDGLGDCEDPDCGRARICLLACADIDLGSEHGERVLTMRSDAATDDFDTACSAGAHDEVAILWTAPQMRTWRVTTAWSRVSTSLALAESCAGPELRCNVDSIWSDAYSGFGVALNEGDSVLFIVEIRQLGEGEFTLNIE